MQSLTEVIMISRKRKNSVISHLIFLWYKYNIKILLLSMKSAWTPNPHKVRCSSPDGKKHVFGSMTRLYWHIITPSRDRVNDILWPSEWQEKIIEQRIKAERSAEKVIRRLLSKCLKNKTYHPTDQEINTALENLRILWCLLPSLKRCRWDTNRTFFLHILEKIDNLRQVQMVPPE